ncbi:MAG: hypothetical protein IPK69_11795 [Phycisphaerales bacterium]|nr:MAG: hypothetical protein IPK69_11795 [Phycisphaerales bacterium]
MSTRKRIELAAQQVAHFTNAAIDHHAPGSAFCVLMWGADEGGTQWRTHVSNTAPIEGPDDTRSRRLALARELRQFADTIENNEDVPPGVVGRG